MISQTTKKENNERLQKRKNVTQTRTSSTDYSDTNEKMQTWDLSKRNEEEAPLDEEKTDLYS
jgi:hypothetical protein